jgi:uncharacterized membrane protein YgcG
MRTLLARLVVVFASLVSCLSLNSCASDPYDYDPEGTSYSSVPYGYTALIVGGISYWHYDDHYCRYWPGSGYVVVRPPHHRPPYQRPPGYKPGHPIHKPGPGYPGYKPGKPGNKPGGPGSKPGRPSTKPSTGKPGTPASRPSIQPVTKPTIRTRPTSGGTSIQPRGSFGGGARSGGGMSGGGMRGGGRRGR